MTDVLTVSGTELARRVREGETTSRALVEAHLAQIAKVNPGLNTYVHLRAEAALAEADAADKVIDKTPPASRSKLPPFHGVPCSIKETFALAGFPQTGGMVSRKELIQQADAVTVQRYRAAGAIPLGITNTSELAMWMESFNKAYGRTGNPYDLKRTCGGSSGGEGAAVGSGTAPFGLGSDIGGSIRLPSFFCGIFGHKPSPGLVPNDGQFPIAEGEALNYQCTGPMTRRHEDLEPLLRILAADKASEIGDPASVSFSDMTVHVVTGDGLWKVDPELAAAQQRAADVLAARGARIVRTTIPQLKRGFDIWSAMLAAESTPFRTQLAEGGEFHAWKEIGKLVRRKSEHTFPAVGLAVIERVPEMMPTRSRKQVAAGLALRDEVEALLAGNSVILYPPYPHPAPKHNQPLLPPLRFTYTAIWNVMLTPITQVPLGLSSQGLPLGVQVIGARGQDHRTLAVAKVLEEDFGGWVPPWFAKGRQS